MNAPLTNSYLQDAPKGNKAKAKKCLNLVKYGINNIFITFGVQYWIYGGFLPVKDKVFTIGGYESAFFADLVATYILEKSKDILDNSIFFKIYRDDGINVDNQILSVDELCD